MSFFNTALAWITPWKTKQHLELLRKQVEDRDRLVRELRDRSDIEIRVVQELLEEANTRNADLELRISGRAIGTAPWFVLKASDVSDVQGLFMEMDWNTAFIQHLKDTTELTAATDEKLVQKWLAFLYSDMIAALEQDLIEQNTQQHGHPIL